MHSLIKLIILNKFQTINSVKNALISLKIVKKKRKKNCQKRKILIFFLRFLQSQIKFNDIEAITTQLTALTTH